MPRVKVKPKLFDDRMYYPTMWRGHSVYQKMPNGEIYFVEESRLIDNIYHVPYIFEDSKMREDIAYFTIKQFSENFNFSKEKDEL